MECKFLCNFKNKHVDFLPQEISDFIGPFGTIYFEIIADSLLKFFTKLFIT